MSEELDEIQAIFFEECAEGLAVAEQGLSAMAMGDVSKEVIAGVFRAVHSIKGGSGAFGHAELLAFSHCFENVLDEVRGGKIPATSEVTKVMLTAFDILTDHVAAAQGTASPPADQAALAALQELLESKGAAAPVTIAAAEPVAPVAEDQFGFTPVVAIVEEFDPFGFEPVGVTLDELDGAAAMPWTVRFGPSRAALANGAEPLLSIREVERLGGTVVAVDSSALPPLRDLDPNESYLVWTLSVPAAIEESAITECFDFVAPDSVVEITRGVAPQQPVPVAPPTLTLIEKVATAPVARAPAPAPESRPMDPVQQTIRIDLTKLDMLLNLVGELVIRGSILSDRLSPADQERVELPELARLTREIQDNVMSLRAQPIRQTFSRVPRMLRDLTSETGKQVILEVSGETTEVDKGVIEKIGDPLTHMIRNAVDHGIESVEERLAAGKSPVGLITLSAEQKGARIFVRVSDDGKGIDRPRVRAKAVEKGIISADAILSDEEIDQLICAPGFSTADTISSISGRGVGMDVVRSNVEALGGRVDISSNPGAGTTFTMILPLTLAILDGMIVRLSGQRFVLPLANVIETVRPEPGQVRPMTPTTEVIELRGQYLPVKRLTDLFGFHADTRRTPEESLVVIVESEAAGNVGLMVDTIDDRREVVIKSLDQNLHPIRGLGGATILGDGSIALILDIDALVSSAGQLLQKFPLKGLAA
ncbi:CheA signal transduction histidine kinase [Novosphingobium sp. Rr 2-17]|uniref:chemotaxis protein CheA n=1 Tax=Novosphingobium sp. Rr 2-17 TaxID=555793 RepID=UPI0002699210|nr:chemotaxis protein CheA [Novosphingobium sp. Rr 2-17]EIZ78698.1 CheA signal transduction histidine kinase [Novosphingobium sp. Rr 2-17]